MRQIQKLLIANRGEIACRIMRTCNELGIKTVAVYSEADRHALHVESADEAVFIGPPEARLSYLDGAKIIDAAKRTGADAIHPGYGFLSENADFAQSVIDAGIIWVGPHPKAMREMGSKTNARRLAKELGVPVVPGYDGDDQTEKTLAAEAKKIGFPIMIKASAGGGGRGIRIAHKAGELDDALKLAKQEAKSAFGDDRMIVERYVAEPRHVEVQIMGDKHGNLVHLFTRDCSIQRRHQKLIEEAPAPNLPDKVREGLHESALKLARAIKYDNAGTVEFLYDGDKEQFYFLEVNTRLQVEHPVTEAITGLDLVEMQIVASWGGELTRSIKSLDRKEEMIREMSQLRDPDDESDAQSSRSRAENWLEEFRESHRKVLDQGDIECNGVAVEVRICAEIPEEGFRPATGEITWCSDWVQHMDMIVHQARIDTGVRAGDTISPYYDSLLFKLIVHDWDRQLAVKLLARNLEVNYVAGLRTNQEYLHAAVSTDAFANAELSTHFLDRHLAKWRPRTIEETFFCIAAATVYAVNREELRFRGMGGTETPWQTLGSWRLLRNAGYPGWTNLVLGSKDRRHLCDIHGTTGAYKVRFEGTTHDVRANLDLYGLRKFDQSHRETIEIDGVSSEFRYTVEDDSIVVQRGKDQLEFRVVPRHEQYVSEAHHHAGSLNDITAPYPGLITEVLVKPGDRVEAGNHLVVMEAMKMIQHLTAQAGGVVKAVYCQPKQTVESGALLVEFEKDEPAN